MIQRALLYVQSNAPHIYSKEPYIQCTQLYIQCTRQISPVHNGTFDAMQLLKRPAYTQKSPTHTQNSHICTQKSPTYNAHIQIKSSDFRRYATHKEPCIYSKEPCTYSKEPHTYSKEPYIQCTHSNFIIGLSAPCNT